MSNDFHSLLSVFHDALSSSAPSSSRIVGRDDDDERRRIARSHPPPPPPPSSTTADSLRAPASASVDRRADCPDPTSASDPSFSAPILRERAERLLRVRQIREMTWSSSSSSSSSSSAERKRAEMRIVICATIVDEFPHEALWRKWMDETGGEFTIATDNGATTTTTTTTTSPGGARTANRAISGDAMTKTAVADDGSGPVDGNAHRPLDGTVVLASADMVVHAKHPERIGSEWLRSKTLPITHRPNWNDVRIVRAILSLLETALRDERTTHVLLCTESCVPVATLVETARSVLLDEVCRWVEEKSPPRDIGPTTARRADDDGRRDLDWDRSYVDYYGRSSGRCSRFDEHNCWDVLRESLPLEIVYKALPGWCLLSRKHAQGILDIPSQLDGMNLWPAFERVWAPEEVFLPTALALSGNIDGVSRRALTYSRWDERAADHRDRAHPLSYDGSFDDELVSRTRAEGCLFLRKMRVPICLSVWEKIVVRRGKGRDSGSGRSPESDVRGRGRGVEGGWDHGRYGDGCDDPYKRNRLHQSGAGYNSRRGHDSNATCQRRKREPDDHSNRDDYQKRQHWRR